MSEFDLYISGMSIPQVSEKTGIPRSTLRNRFKKAGILRSRGDGVRSAGTQGRLGSGMRGKKRVFSKSHRESIKKSAIKRGKNNSCGVSVKPSGYVEITRGEYKGRLVHIVVMESRLGRKLYSDECVHHIDRDKTNNAENNLALVTKSGHARIHRFEDKLSGNERRRNKNGTWS